MPGISFEWDDRKRLATLSKHGIDFIDAVRVFGAFPMISKSRDAEEERFIAIGPVNGIMIAVVFTLRETAIRIVTARRARQDERRRYHEALGR
jgi:hypothetical protein